MDLSTPRFPRRAAAGLIDLTVCLALTMIFTLAWMVAQLGSCDCPTTASLQGYFADAAIVIDETPESLLFVPTLLYVVWSWTPLAGGRSVGKRLMRIRPIIAAG